MGALGTLIPLVVLFLVVGGGAYIGYQVYLWSNEMTDRGKKHMEKKHMSFTKDGGLKVGVKERTNEQYEDKTQSVLVNVWNNANVGGAKQKSASGSSTPRPSASREASSSSQARPSNHRMASGASASGAATLSPPASRSGQRRSASPIPGSFS